MRVAVIVTGQMRDYKVNVENHMKHLIEPNNADVFVYACSKNTVHTIGSNISQKYNITSHLSASAMEDEISRVYGKHLIRVLIDEDEELDDSDFGTLGYFKKRMNNQMSNIRKGYLMAMEYSEQMGFDYDIIVRCRPDNSMFPSPVPLFRIPTWSGEIHSTVYPSGHRDPWFFAFANPKTFDKYCSYIYMDGEDDSRTDGNFDSPESGLERYLIEDLGAKISLHQSICRPFYEYDKTKDIVEFPHVRWHENLLDASGSWVPIPRDRKSVKNIAEDDLMHMIESLYLDDPNNFLLLEIGANDGYVCDRMHPFVKKYDPNAIMVEPIKGYFDKLRKNYSDLKNIKYENVAISDTEGTATMTYIPQEDIQKGKVKFRLEDQPELHHEHWAGGLGSLYKEKNNLGCPELKQFQKKVEVPLKTLEYLEEKYGISRYENVVVQTDCEGHDYEILKTFDFNKIKPKVYISEIYSKTRYPEGHPRYGTDEGLYTKEEEAAAIDIYYNNGYSLYRSNDLIAILEECDDK
jgi:FkbM family methyltransferase